jgi:hypothetical protein
MLTEILTEIKNLKNQGEEFSKETTKEITGMKREIKRQEEMWGKRHNLETEILSVTNQTKRMLAVLEEKLKSLEESEEPRARREKRNSIIIKINEIVPD